MSVAIEVSSDRVICTRCGIKYSKRKGYFPVSYAINYKGIGHLPICKDCIEKMYGAYLSQCENVRDSVRQMCRKLDLYWNESVFETVSKKSSTRSIMTQYIQRINSLAYAGKSYDDTLLSEGSLWSFDKHIESSARTENDTPVSNEDSDDIIPVSPEVKAYWGNELSDQTCRDLEKRKAYWLSKFPDRACLDAGTEAIIKQICGLEFDISRDRAAGKSVDKSVNALNTLLGSANMKPTQTQKNDGDSAMDNTPFGVWIQRWENQRPIPEVDPELKDVDKIKKYITVWFMGHLSKMLNIKNTYCKLYEEELAKMRVDRPEFEDDDDETLFNDIFGSDSSEEDSERNVSEAPNES